MSRDEMTEEMWGDAERRVQAEACCHVSSEQRQSYKDTAGSVVCQMPPGCTAAAHAHVTHPHMHRGCLHAYEIAAYGIACAFFFSLFLTHKMRSHIINYTTWKKKSTLLHTMHTQREAPRALTYSIGSRGLCAPAVSSPGWYEENTHRAALSSPITWDG